MESNEFKSLKIEYKSNDYPTRLFFWAELAFAFTLLVCVFFSGYVELGESNLRVLSEFEFRTGMLLYVSICMLTAYFSKSIEKHTRWMMVRRDVLNQTIMISTASYELRNDVFKAGGYGCAFVGGALLSKYFGLPIVGYIVMGINGVLFLTTFPKKPTTLEEPTPLTKEDKLVK